MPRIRNYRQGFQQVLAASAARTTPGNGTGFANLGRAQAAKVDVTAATGSVTVTVQDSPDGSAWTTRVTFPARSTVGSDVLPVPLGLAAQVRAAWTVTGTSVTFSVQLASSDGALL